MNEEHPCVICRVIEFLPYQCDLCKKWFCRDHFQPFIHNCPVKQAAPPVAKEKESYRVKERCIVSGCKQSQIYLVACERCKGKTCIAHMHRHNCPAKT